MARSCLSLAFSLLLLSLLVIASAGDDSSKYGFDGIPADSPQAKPDADDSSKYGFDGMPADSPQAKPDANDSSKYGFDGIPADGPQAKPEGEEKSHYNTKSDYSKPEPLDNEKRDYGKSKPNYGTKEDIYKPKPEEKSEEKQRPAYGRKPFVVKPKPEGEEKPYYGSQPEESENRPSIGVQGLVLCKSGSKYSPLQGALAKITCKAVDEVGVEKTLSICSEATDAKGYFLATLSSLDHVDKLKLKECKAYLESSPLENCKVPTNVNKAIDGALLSAFRVLKEKKMKLYSVGPFFYTSEATSAPNGY